MWIKYSISTLFHTHMAAACAWSHVVLVEKNTYTTPKQAPKNVANTKSNRPLSHICGAL
jgi:hypothetical protein